MTSNSIKLMANILYSIFDDEVKKRSKRTNLEYPGLECKAMYFAVNKQRRLLGKTETNLNTIRHLYESMPDGYDFVSKCAELVICDYTEVSNLHESTTEHR
jgi:hypothetical protein